MLPTNKQLEAMELMVRMVLVSATAPGMKVRKEQSDDPDTPLVFTYVDWRKLIGQMWSIAGSPFPIEVKVLSSTSKYLTVTIRRTPAMWDED